MCDGDCERGNNLHIGSIAAEGKSSILSFAKIALLIGQVILAAFGEEIAYRGFFLEKGLKIFPMWVCVVVSSAVFAVRHIATGNIGIVACDIATVFIDSLIFSVIYHFLFWFVHKSP